MTTNDIAAILNHVRAASEALGLCVGLARDAGTVTDAHDVVLERGRVAIAALAEAAMAHGMEIDPALASAGHELYLVWSNEHSAWWRPNEHGYTRNVDRAGRYDRKHALKIAGTRGGGWPHEGNPYEIAIPERDAVAQAGAG